MKNSRLQESIIWFLVSIVLVLVFNTDTQLCHNIYAYLATASYVLCIYNWVKTGNRPISLFSFFIVYAFFCNCSQQFFSALGVPDEFLTSYYDVNLDSMKDMLRFQYISISALNLGAMYYTKNRYRCVSSKNQEKWYKFLNSAKSADDKKLYIVFIICMLGAILAAYKTAQVRSSMSYRDYMYGGAEKVNQLFYFGYFYAFLGLRYIFRKQHVKLIYVSWLLLTAIYLALGLRTQAIPYICYFVIALPVTHSFLFKKQYWPAWIGVCFIFIVLLGWISSTRDMVGNSLTGESQGLGIDFLLAVSDIGSSSQTIAITMNSINNGLEHAQSILYFLITVIPERVFKVPHEIMIKILPFGGEACESPGAFISHHVGGAGLGFSFLSESFLNFGWFGCVFVFIYGFLIAFLEDKAYRAIMRGYYFPITFLLILCKQIFYARGDLWLCNSYIAYMVYTYFIYIILSKRQRLKLF